MLGEDNTKGVSDTAIVLEDYWHAGCKILWEFLVQSSVGSRTVANPVSG